MIKIITTFKKIMTRILLILLCLPMLFSCDQENKVYNAFIGEKGEKIVQMVKKDDINKIAYLAMFKDIEKDSIFMMSESIAQYYDIEGYDMFIGDSSNYFISEEMKELVNSKDWELSRLKVNTEFHITPYQYRTAYVNNNGDTIAKIIKRNALDGREAAILTDKRYTRRDTTTLIEAIKYLNADEVYIFDSIPSKLYVTNEDLINAYSYYRGFTNEFFFWNEAADENRFSINGANVMNVRDDRLYTKYWTNRFLTNEEILQIKQEKNSSKWKTVVYFYIPYEYDKEYASIHFNKNKNEYTIFMFNEKKTYTYNVSKKLWSSYGH